MDRRVRSLVAMDMRGVRDEMKRFSLKGFSLPLRSGLPLDLLQGVGPLNVNQVQVTLEGRQVILRNAQLLLLGIVPVTQWGIVGGVGRHV